MSDTSNTTDRATRAATIAATVCAARKIKNTLTAIGTIVTATEALQVVTPPVVKGVAAGLVVAAAASDAAMKADALATTKRWERQADTMCKADGVAQIGQVSDATHAALCLTPDEMP